MKRLLVSAVVLALFGVGAGTLLSGSSPAQAQINYGPSPCGGLQSVSPEHGQSGKLWVVKDCAVYFCTPDKKEGQFNCVKQTLNFQ